MKYQLKTGKRQPSNENVKFLYNIFRNRVNRDLKKSKKSYYATYFVEHCNNIKKIWDGIRSIVNIKKSTNTYITQLTNNIKGIEVPNATAVNNFFVNVNVGPNTEKSVPKVPNILPENSRDSLGSPISDGFGWSPTPLTTKYTIYNLLFLYFFLSLHILFS